jgi:hypothetical protein
MDHLPAVSRRSEAIPYLGMGGDESYSYSREGFYSFPDKNGQSIRALLRGDAPNLEQQARESFFQAWLYFGLLHEFAAPHEPFYIENFYKFEGGFPVLHTKLLLDYLELWRDSILSMPESMRKTRQMRTTIVLKDARLVICERISNDAQSEWHIDPRHSTSLMILGETLSWAMQQLEIYLGAPITGWTGHMGDGWGPSSLVFDRL